MWTLASKLVSAALFVTPLTCFQPQDSRKLTYEVYQQAPPPVGEPRIYRYYPATAYATQAVQRIADTSGAPFKRYYFQWANRSTRGVINPQGLLVARKANFQPGPMGARTLRAQFSSVAQADACTLAQTAAVLGASPQAVERLARDGHVSTARPDDRTPDGVASAVDTCALIGDPAPPDMTGVLLDYEVQDGRTPAQTLAFLTRFADLVHKAGKQAILLINPLDAPSQRYTGVTAANANAITHLFDRTTLFLWSRNAQGDIGKSFDRQMDILKAGGPVDPKRLIANFELANTSQSDARWVRAAVVRDGLAGVMFWRDYAVQGDACDTDVNRKIACLAFGRCSA